MHFDFDTPPDRRGTDSQKWQKYAGAARDTLPMWVADMDFKSSPAIIDALHARVDHGIFGYARPVPSTTDAILGAFERLYAWKIDPSWIVWMPGLVCALNVTARAFAAEADEVLTFTPVYPPFMTGPKNQARASRSVSLVLSSGRWIIDWEALEAAVTPRTKLFYLCHPHNPLARVWRKDELVRLADFVHRHNLILCSDEIHCDLILDPELSPHLPAAVAAGDALSSRLITLMAPSKTYNVPGLGTSLAIIPDAALRAKFIRGGAGIVPEVTNLGYVACEAAYRDSEPWRQALLAYLRGNRDYLLATLASTLPQIRVEAPIEATYLAWMNVSKLGLPDPYAHFASKGVGLSDGAPFGAPPGTYLRINFGCPRATLAEALRRMAQEIR